MGAIAPIDFEKGLTELINFPWNQGSKGILHPCIEILNGLLGILHPSIEIPNDALVNARLLKDGIYVVYVLIIVSTEIDSKQIQAYSGWNHSKEKFRNDILFSIMKLMLIFKSMVIGHTTALYTNTYIPCGLFFYEPYKV